MGKDLKGRDLGKGIRQRKDGRYEARAIVNSVKINIIKPTLKECMADFKEAKEMANNNMDIKRTSITLNEWFEEWFDKYKKPYIKVLALFRVGKPAAIWFLVWMSPLSISCVYSSSFI